MKKTELAKRITSCLTLGVFSTQSLLAFAAEILPDNNAPVEERPLVMETANGIPLVHITDPTAGGVSVNHYEFFNVPERGAILNNSFDLVSTQLAGYVQGNPNLISGTAHVIVNEVTSANPSELRGFLEVAGNKADIVIANPNGILADGAGFLNTARVILATGRTELDGSGNLASLRVDSGNIVVAGKGLNGLGADSAELYARAIEVNAGLWAKDAKIVTGTNVIGYGDGVISPSEEKGDAPAYALDVAEIGGMYANRITLIGTEKGVGVNLQGQITSTQATSLDVNGNLKTAGNLYSDGNTSLQAETVENSGKIISNGNTEIRAETVVNKGGAVYGNEISIQAEKLVNEKNAALESRLAEEMAVLKEKSDTLEAAHKEDVTRFTNAGAEASYRRNIEAAERAYDAQLKIVEDIKKELAAHPASAIAARQKLSVDAGTIRNSGDSLLYAGEDMDLSVRKKLINNGAQIEAKGSIRIAAPVTQNENAAFSAKRVITKIQENPTKLRIDEGGHSEQGQAFPEWEFTEKDSGYGAIHSAAPGEKINHFTVVRSHSILSEEQVQSSLPGSIRAGRDILLDGTVENEDSRVVAGGTLQATGPVHNTATMQQEMAVTFGTVQPSYTERRNWLHKGKVRKYGDSSYMTPEIAKSNPSPLGIQLYADSKDDLAKQADITAKERERVQSALSPFGLVPMASGQGEQPGQVGSFSISALYRVHPEATAKYLVETDPAFTSKRKFLSSDYMYRQLKWDMDKVPRRIGDGFYEQQLLADQILRQTGKRHLEGYEDDEEAYKALMDAGVAYAKEVNLAPGIALSKEQATALTRDMIWLEEREVTLNGKRERGIYPVLYSRNAKGLRLSEGGSLISAKNLVLETKEGLTNAGTLYGESIQAAAGNIENTGQILGQNINLSSGKDIQVQGSILGDKNVLLEAKGDIAVKSTTERLAHQDVLNTTAGISVTGDGGRLVMNAGKNLGLAGATLMASGEKGKIQLAAGQDAILSTKKLQSDKDMTASAENYLRTKRGTELGTKIHADGDITISSGNDIVARAAIVSSEEGTVSLAAGNDIALEAGRETAEDHYGIQYKGSGLLSTKTTTIRSDAEMDTARTTDITGKNVSLSAKRDIALSVANIVADKEASVDAGRDFSAASAENHSHTENHKAVKKSGILSSGGIGFMIGTQETKTTRDRDSMTQQGTNIAALDGSVSVNAEGKAHISSSNILAGKDATLSAKEITIDGKDNVYRDILTQEEKTTGLTISFGAGLLDLGQEIYTPIKRMGEVRDDRLKALYAYQAGRILHDEFSAGNPLTDKSISLHIGLGTSQSYSRTENIQKEYAGSQITAGENASLTAKEKDLTVKGSNVAGRDVSLAAQGNVRLEAGEDTSITTTEDRYSSAGLGAAFFPQGLSGLSLHANKGQGDSREAVTTYTPSRVSAEKNLCLSAGKDVDVIGSKVQGSQIAAKVGGNLHIETLQDKETYREQNTSAGIGVSWSLHGGAFSKPTFGGDWSKGNIDSHYRSAREQAGFYAGKDGFDIYVQGNTDLKGGMLASKAFADKNHLSTGTFSFSDLENKADYSAIGIGASYHAYGDYDKMKPNAKNKIYNTIGLAPNLSMPAMGKADSSTKSAVAPGRIDIRENPTQDVSVLSRDTRNALNELGRIFDKKTVEEQQELARVFGEEAFRLAHNLRDDGSGRKIAVHAIIGGIMSQITGTGVASGAIGAGVNEAVIGEIKKIKDPGMAQIVSTIVGAASAKLIGKSAGSGIVSAVGGTKWNYLAEDHVPVTIGISVKDAGLGHVGIVVETDTGAYDSADYGRYGTDVVESSSGFAAPIGQGTVITRWFYDPTGKYTYMLNPEYVNPEETVNAYNDWIKSNGYLQIPIDQTTNYFGEAWDESINQNTQYYRNGEEDYNLLSNNCATTTRDAIIQGTVYKALSPEAAITIERLRNEFNPSTIREILEEDLIEFQGKGLVVGRAF